jgi:hypothetical protein
VVQGWIYFWSSDLRNFVTAAHPGQCALLVYGRSRNTWNPGEAEATRMETRTYVLVPRVFHEPRVHTVTRVNDDAPTLHEDSIPVWAILAIVGTILGGATAACRKPGA